VSEYEHNEHLLDEIQRLRESNFHLRKDCEEQKQRIKRLEEALESIQEYWNRDNNNQALIDACWYAIDKAAEALEAKEDKP
jgi:predicted RNase H-like nuclease (RuvC/YqgF family)